VYKFNKRILKVLEKVARISSADEDVAVFNHVKQRISPEPLLQRLDITVFLYHKI